MKYYKTYIETPLSGSDLKIRLVLNYLELNHNPNPIPVSHNMWPPFWCESYEVYDENAAVAQSI